MPAATPLLCLMLSLAPQQRPPATQSPRPLASAGAAGPLRVTAEVRDGVATTRWRQVIRNHTSRPREARWVLPLPPGAAADQLRLTVDGVETTGEVLDAGRARGIYERIVRQRRDPALLEYDGQGCVRARVFPVPARGQVTLEVRFRHVLPQDGGLLAYRLPLSAPSVDGTRPDATTFDLSVHSTDPIVNVFSPLAGVEIARRDDHSLRISAEYDAPRTTGGDGAVYWGTGDADFGVHLLTHRRPGEPGYFLALLSPKVELPDGQRLAKSIQLVLDTSGSMKGDKIAQARAAVRFFLRSLHPEDHFNVVPFSTEARPFFSEPVPASAEHVAQALQLTATITARGGTNIEDALHCALRAASDDQRVPMTVLLTDGQPTVGTTDARTLVASAGSINDAGQRIFALGVGDDVNTHLLDHLAASTQGARSYIRPGEDIGIVTTGLLTKLSHPVLARPTLDLGGARVYGVMPQTLADLFRGSRVGVVGRYTEYGHHAVRLRGAVAGCQKEFVYEGTFAEECRDHEFLPALWAERRVAVLLESIRINGHAPELTEEVERLGVEFGLVTPFTSHLVIEESVRLGASPGPRTAALPRSGTAATPRPSGPASGGPSSPAPPPGAAAAASKRRFERLGQQQTGAEAVADSRALVVGADQFFTGGTGGQRARPTTPPPAAPQTRRAGGRTFYQVGEVWIDRAYGDQMRRHVRRIEAFSDDYFALLRAHPDLAACLALGPRVRIVLDAATPTVIETTPAG